MAVPETSVLLNMYQQGGDQISYVDGQDKEYVQTWKGPWSEILKLYSNNPVVCGTTINVGMPFTPGTQWKTEFPLSQTFNWKIKGYSVQESVDGDHGILKLILTPRNTDSPYYDHLSSWNLTWGQFTVSPLAYCSNLSGKANAVNIVHAVNYYRDYNMSTDLSVWVENGKTYTLNSDELSIAKMYANDIYGQFSYPIVTLRSSYANVSSLQDIDIPDWGDKMNIISTDFTLPGNVVFDPGEPSFLSSSSSSNQWVWILRDFTVEQTNEGAVYINNTKHDKWSVTMNARWEGSRDGSEIQEFFYSANNNVRKKLNTL